MTQTKNYPAGRKRKALTITSIALLIAAAASFIICYSFFLKRNTANAMATIPADAAYVLQINDNEGFMKSVGKCLPYLNEALSLNALDGFEFFIDEMGEKGDAPEQAVIAATAEEGKLRLMLCTRTEEHRFKKMLKALQLNPKNCSKYRGIEVYEIATHHCAFHFCYHNGLFTAAETPNALYRSIDCIATPHSLTQQKDFKPINEIVSKNGKQNWLIINHNAFIDSKSDDICENRKAEFAQLKEKAEWSAYQVSFSDCEMILSGYSVLKDGAIPQSLANLAGSPLEIPAAAIPSNITELTSFNTTITFENDSLQRQTDNLHCLKFSANGQEHRLLIVRDDTTATCIASLRPDNLPADSVVIYKRFSISPNLSSSDFTAGISSISPNYFTEYQGNIIFADSIPTLKAYIDIVSVGKTIATNQLFLFAQERMPSNCIFSLYYQNTDKNLAQWLSPSFMKNHSKLATLKSIGFSAMPAQDGIIPNNIVVRFQ